MLVFCFNTVPRKMQDIIKRNILFLFGCIPLRLLIALTVAICPKDWLIAFCFFALIPIFGWINIIFINPRTTGPEVFGQEIWWQNYRIIHLSLWIIAFILALKKNRMAAGILLLDTLIGLVLFIRNRETGAGDVKPE